MYVANVQPNHYIEDIESYLENCDNVVLEGNYDNRDFKEDNLTLYLKIAANDTGCSYLKCTDDTKTRYYYITSSKWLNDGTTQIEATLDVVNSFQDVVTNTDRLRRVKVLRRHKDRFNKLGQRKYDVCDEGITPDAYTCISSVIYDNPSYLVYKEETADSTGIVVNPAGGIRKLWYPKTSQSVNTTQYKKTVKLKYSDSKVYYDDGIITPYSVGDDSRVLLLSNSNITIRINRTNKQQYTAFANAILMDFGSMGGALMLKFFNYDNGYLTYISSSNYPLTKADDYTSNVLEIYSDQPWNYYRDLGSTASIPSFSVNDKFVVSQLVSVDPITVSPESISIQANPIDIVNKTNSAIKQITEVPFIPKPDALCYLGGLNNEIVVREDSDYLQGSYIFAIPTVLKPPKITGINEPITKSQQYESKLYGSYCKNYYLSYDNATLPIQPEKWYQSSTTNLDTITFYAPVNLSNNLAFKLSDFRPDEPYSNWLITSRNNNLQIYTNEYVEYCRTGYNYDVKAKNIQTAKDWIGFGVGLAGAATTGTFGVASRKRSESGNIGLFLGQSAVNAGVGAVGNLVNNILNASSNNDALKKRKQDAMNATVNVSGSDDLSLFHAYNEGSGLRFNYTVPREQTNQAMFDLFYYYGYADNSTYATLPTIKTRKYFNYVQAEIDYITPSVDLPQQISAAIQSAYSTGITFEWKYFNTWVSKGNLYENFEIWV